MFTFGFGGGCFTVVSWFDENCRDVGFPGFGFGVVVSGGYGSVGLLVAGFVLYVIYS